MKIISICALLVFSVHAQAAMNLEYSGYPFGGLNAFTTDGCTHFPDGTNVNANLWHHCCVAHDLKYWAGGSYTARLNADLALRSCVAATGHVETADLMFAGVRVGGSPYYPTPFRWGYGWQMIRGYWRLTADEQLEVERLKPQSW